MAKLEALVVSVGVALNLRLIYARQKFFKFSKESIVHKDAIIPPK